MDERNAQVALVFVLTLAVCMVGSYPGEFWEWLIEKFNIGLLEF